MSILVPCGALFAVAGFFFWMAHTTSRGYRKRRRHDALTGATMASKETEEGLIILTGKERDDVL